MTVGHGPTDAGTIDVARAGAVATVTWDRPPHNFVTAGMLAALADRLDELDQDDECRCIVVTGAGRSFCAGADFGPVLASEGSPDSAAIYRQAMRLFDGATPIVAAVNGAAIGAGAGLALAADFRVGGAGTRFAFTFARLGFHPGFGTSLTLPRLVGGQRAARLFYTGERIDGERCAAIGLIDQIVPDDEILGHAQILAREIAGSAPLAVRSIRQALRGQLAAEVRACNAEELRIQIAQFETTDFREGIAAAQERRPPRFTGQ